MKKWIPLIAFVVIVAIWFAYPLYATWINPDLPNRGLAGDMYGGLNTLFSGLAFAGLIYTVILQREELGLQRKELELTRAELERTAKANEEAAKAMADQVKNQLVAARITGLTGLLSSYDQSVASYDSRGMGAGSARDTRDGLRDRLAGILKENGV